MRRLFRDPDNKVLGGVASGLAAYMGWDVTWVRIILLVLGFFVHGVILAYIIAWIIIPMARTAPEKLAMKGAAINMENIGKTVTDGFEKVNDYVRSDRPRSILQKIGEGIVSVAGFLIKFSIDPEKVNPKYIKYYCMSDTYKGWVHSFNTGSTRGNINAQTLGGMPIPLPPRPQQDGIVDILSSLDAKIRKNADVNENLFNFLF